jgi:hypothetical protein
LPGVAAEAPAVVSFDTVQVEDEDGEDEELMLM